MKLVPFVRGALEFGRIVTAELIEEVSKRIVARLLPAPARIELPDCEDVLREVTDAQMAEFAARRLGMQARPAPPPVEDEPPGGPPIGSLEWRARQARPSRPG